MAHKRDNYNAHAFKFIRSRTQQYQIHELNFKSIQYKIALNCLHKTKPSQVDSKSFYIPNYHSSNDERPHQHTNAE